jgi:hypothetical protein
MAHRPGEGGEKRFMSLLWPRMTGYGMDGSPPQINDFFTTSWSMTMLAYTCSGALVFTQSWLRNAGSREGIGDMLEECTQ